MGLIQNVSFALSITAPAAKFISHSVGKNIISSKENHSFSNAEKEKRKV